MTNNTNNTRVRNSIIAVLTALGLAIGGALFIASPDGEDMVDTLAGRPTRTRITPTPRVTRTVTAGVTSTATSTVTPSATATATHTNTPTRSATPIPTETLTPIPGADGILFGPFHLPLSEFSSGEFTGGFVDLDLASAESVLEGARVNHLKVLIHLTGGRNQFQNADLSFSLTKWKEKLDEWDGLADTIQFYVDSGTIAGHMVADEPQDAGNWNGAPVPCTDMAAAVAYSHEKWPSMLAGAGTQPTSSWWQTCANGAMDFTSSPYNYTNPRGRTAAAFIDDTFNFAGAKNARVFPSLNVYGNGTPATAAQLREFGELVLNDPRACGMTMWKHTLPDGLPFFGLADIKAVVADLSDLAAGREPCP